MDARPCVQPCVEHSPSSNARAPVHRRTAVRGSGFLCTRTAVRLFPLTLSHPFPSLSLSRCRAPPSPPPLPTTTTVAPPATGDRRRLLHAGKPLHSSLFMFLPSPIRSFPSPVCPPRRAQLPPAVSPFPSDRRLHRRPSPRRPPFTFSLSLTLTHSLPKP